MDAFQAIAFDPGGSTGWAHFAYKLVPGNDLWFDSGTIDYQDHHSAVRNKIQTELEGWSDVTVITERFEFRQDARKGLDLISREYIGVMKLICQDLCVPLIQVSASGIQHYGNPKTENNFMNYKKLARLDQLHQPLEANRHRHDALQHLVAWLAAKKHVEEIRERIKRAA